MIEFFPSNSKTNAALSEWWNRVWHKKLSLCQAENEMSESCRNILLNPDPQGSIVCQHKPAFKRLRSLPAECRWENGVPCEDPTEAARTAAGVAYMGTQIGYLLPHVILWAAGAPAATAAAGAPGATAGMAGASAVSIAGAGAPAAASSHITPVGAAKGILGYSTYGIYIFRRW